MLFLIHLFKAVSPVAETLPTLQKGTIPLQIKKWLCFILEGL